MKRISLLATDFDGTIFRYGNEYPLYADFLTRLTELRAQGGKWLLSTGRPMRNFRRASQTMNSHVIPLGGHVHRIIQFVIGGFMRLFV